MPKRIQTAPKTCQHCGKSFERGRMASGRIEAIDDWSVRKYCAHSCYDASHKGENHPRYVDGFRRGHDCGYLRVSDGRYVHRLAMEKALGRNLLSSEHVHHIDGNVLNNAPENLELTTNSRHRKLHAYEQKRGPSGKFIKETS